jgi:predicted nucleic acid-binding protein
VIQELRIDTANIRRLRALLSSDNELFASIGQLAQFRVVIDANFVIRDLLQKIRHPERGETALDELVSASVIEVYAPRWLETELKSAIQQISKKGGVAEDHLWSAWSHYQALIKWDETWVKPPDEFKPTDDPKDLPYVFLETLVGANGVLSNDRDIERMGGNRLTLDFVLSTRDYARAAVVSVCISVSGRFVGTMAIGSLVRVIAAIKSSLEKLSPKWKLALFGVAVFAFLHPSSRAWLTKQLRKLGPTGKVLFEAVVALAALQAQKHEDAKEHLAIAYAAAKLDHGSST